MTDAQQRRVNVCKNTGACIIANPLFFFGPNFKTQGIIYFGRKGVYDKMSWADQTLFSF
jgi:hypothetical protein